MERTLGGMLAMVAARGQRPFAADPAGALDSAAFAAAAERLAHALSAAGAGPGDRVLLALEHGIGQAVGIFAVALAGAISVVAHPRLRDAQVRHLVTDSGARCAVLSPARATGFVDAGAVFAGCRVLAPDASAPAVPLPVARPGEPATILYTSGSTGAPKGIVQSHRNLVDGAEIVAGYLGLRPEDRLLGVVPLSFDYGLNQLLDAAWIGALITFHPFLSAGELLAQVADRGATVLAGVPSLWHAIAAALRGGTDPALGRRLRVITSTGGRLGRADIATLRAAWPETLLFSMYGMTEAFRSAYLPPAQIDRIPDSFGRAVPGVELFVLDRASGARCAAGVPGELVHAGKFVGLGYWQRPLDTARVFRPHPFDPARGTAVWSGDTVHADADGWLYFDGRGDTQWKVHGHRVAPDEFEQLLLQLDGVEQAVVFADEDPAVGHRVVACVTGRGHEREWLRALRAQAPPHLVPARLVHVGELPLTPNGKVDLPALRRRWS
jgi:acyl-coenzyme A synthetase/AMP-(fatty) acid ligase